MLHLKPLTLRPFRPVIWNLAPLELFGLRSLSLLTPR